MAQNMKGSDKKVNLNTASKEEIAKIHGIGDDMAAEIVRYREENNGFKSIDDLDMIPGFMPKAKDKFTV